MPECLTHLCTRLHRGCLHTKGNAHASLRGVQCSGSPEVGTSNDIRGASGGRALLCRANSFIRESVTSPQTPVPHSRNSGKCRNSQELATAHLPACWHATHATRGLGVAHSNWRCLKARYSRISGTCKNSGRVNLRRAGRVFRQVYVDSFQQDTHVNKQLRH